MNIMRCFLCLFLFYLSLSQFPKIVWVYWESGFDNCPLITKLCSQNHQHFIKSPWELRQLSAETAQQWLNKIPGFQGLPDMGFLESKLQLQTDFLRLYLLKHYGGVWIDANIILFQDFDWVLQLPDNEDVINKYGTFPEVFMFYLPFYGSTEKWYDGKTEWRVSPGYETWFIAAQPNSTFIDEWLLWYKNFFTMGKIHKDAIITKNRIKLGGLRGSNYLITSQAIQYVIQKKQQQLDKQYGSIDRKLAVNHYKLWAMPADEGPLKLQLNYLNWDFFHLARDLTQINSSLIMEDTKQKYFIKLTAQAYRALTLSFKDSFQDVSFQKAITTWLAGSWNELMFPSSHFILKNSIMDKYLLQLSPSKKIQTTITDHKLPKIVHPHWVTQLCMLLFPICSVYLIYLSFKIKNLMKEKRKKSKVSEDEERKPLKQ